MKRAALALALLWLSGCAHWWGDPLPKRARVHRAKTADGWELSLVQYPAQGTPRGRPVLLCHGISANSRNLDLDDDHSLARWFAAHGREAWTLSLRGTGDSDGVDEAKGRHAGYAFDAFWREDLPAAVSFVRAKAGVDAIDFVGHSMGGMIAYAYLSQGGQGINALVTLGSPTRLDWNGALDPYVAGLVGFAFGNEGNIPVVGLAHAFMPLHGEITGTPVDLLLYNPKNVKPSTWKRLMAIGIADMPGALTMQMVGFLRQGTFGSNDGKLDFRKDMKRITRPVLVVAGKGDRVAFAPAVKDGFRALGGPKEWLVVGELNGAEADYGHMDLVIGERAPTELWPKLLDFLDRHP